MARRLKTGDGYAFLSFKDGRVLNNQCDRVLR
jgi:hypothetical protein